MTSQKTRTLCYVVLSILFVIEIFRTIFGDKKIDIIELLIFISLLSTPFMDSYYLKKKINKLKRELNIKENLSYEQLFQMKLEKEYQEKMAKTFKM